MSYSYESLSAFSDELGTLYGAEVRGSANRRLCRPDQTFPEDEAYLVNLLESHLAPARQNPPAANERGPVAGAREFFRLRTLRLTGRECGVLFWVSHEKRDAEIAMILGCAKKTTGRHVEHGLAKLKVETRLTAAHAPQEWPRDRLQRHPSTP